MEPSECSHPKEEPVARIYALDNRMTPVSSLQDLAHGRPVAIAAAPPELDSLTAPSEEGKQALRLLASAENTYLDVFPSCLVGSFAVPDKARILDDPTCFTFYLDRDRLVFLDESGTCERLLSAIAEQGVLKQPTTAHCLFECMKLLIKGDLAFLADLEDQMEDVEEAIIDRGMDASNRRMLLFRRKLLRIDTYYQQLVDMTSSLAENENKMLAREETRLFLSLQKQVERLLKRSLTLKEYSLQLRELYQAQIDIQQNNTMKFFAVVTTLFAPLTLLTSWFGMNFAHMPGIDWSWGYQAVIALSIVIILVELAIFKRKKWL